jgi:hypothetical protein
MTAADIIRTTTITEVWIGLGGDPPVRNRARAFYRDGDNPQAVFLNEAKRCWYDFRDNIGGGILDLIQRALGCDRAGAARWLSDFTRLPLDDRPMTPLERSEYGHQRMMAEQLARDVADWERGLELILLDWQKTAAAITTWLMGQDADPGEVLSNSRRDLKMLHRADADTLVYTYRELPEPFRRPFREAGRRDREHAERVTLAIVGVLARFEGVFA